MDARLTALIDSLVLGFPGESAAAVVVPPAFDDVEMRLDEKVRVDLTQNAHVPPASIVLVEQTVYLNARLRRELVHYVKTVAGPGPVFRSGDVRGIGRRQVQMRFSHWRDRAGLGRGYTAHCLRHTFATRLYQQTRDLHLVREALGHAGVGTTQRYAVIDKRNVRTAVTRLR